VVDCSQKLLLLNLEQAKGTLHIVALGCNFKFSSLVFKFLLLFCKIIKARYLFGLEQEMKFTF